ncbi:MAG TPA: tetratricopeptide repeat protein, partial [Blastocatellia bacterium]|nr:tetratricopeptide repeat protein [Blastocatellia bacterium]
AGMEKELRNYISKDSYPVITFTSDEKLVFDNEMQSSKLPEAEAEFYLGDLAWHLRYASAEQHLQKAISLDPNLASAHASLGMMQMYQGKVIEARQHLERAVSLDRAGKNHRIYFYYAQALQYEQSENNKTQLVSGMNGEKAKRMRAALQKAIAINPSFVESYNLLAFVNLVTNENLDESVAMLKRAMNMAQGKHELAFTLAQIYLRQQKFEDSRQLLEPLARSASQPELRQQAQMLLDQLDQFRRQMAESEARLEREKSEIGTTTGEVSGRPRLLRREQRNTESGNRPSNDPNAIDMLKDNRIVRQRFEGERISGMLIRMDCPAKGNDITLHIKAGNRTIKLHSTAMDRVEFITYNEAPGSMIQCGPLNPPKAVTVIYRTSTDASSEYDGEPLAVMFGSPQQK